MLYIHPDYEHRLERDELKHIKIPVHAEGIRDDWIGINHSYFVDMLYEVLEDFGLDIIDDGFMMGKYMESMYGFVVFQSIFGEFMNPLPVLPGMEHSIAYRQGNGHQFGIEFVCGVRFFNGKLAFANKRLGGGYINTMKRSLKSVIDDMVATYWVSAHSIMSEIELLQRSPVSDQQAIWVIWKMWQTKAIRLDEFRELSRMWELNIPYAGVEYKTLWRLYCMCAEWIQTRRPAQQYWRLRNIYYCMNMHTLSRTVVNFNRYEG